MADDASRLQRAQRICAAAPKAVCSTKGGPIRFGMPANLGLDVIRYQPAAFDAMSDEAVMADLRKAWGANGR